MNILITGANGFLGSTIVWRAAETKYSFERITQVNTEMVASLYAEAV